MFRAQGQRGLWAIRKEEESKPDNYSLRSQFLMLLTTPSNDLPMRENDGLTYPVQRNQQTQFQGDTSCLVLWLGLSTYLDVCVFINLRP